MGQWDYSWCRFHCGIERREMGSLEYTDGVWIWPQGLAHYVEYHSVVLPDEFVQNCRLNAWTCPELKLESHEDFVKLGLMKPDKTVWLEWSGRYLEEKGAGRAEG